MGSLLGVKTFIGVGVAVGVLVGLWSLKRDYDDCVKMRGALQTLQKSYNQCHAALELHGIAIDNLPALKKCEGATCYELFNKVFKKKSK